MDKLPIEFLDEEKDEPLISMDKVFGYLFAFFAGIGAITCVIASVYLYGLMDVKVQQAQDKEVKCGSCRLSKEATK